MKNLIPLLLICLLPLAAAELHVGTNQTHTSIAAAIAAATEGDTITVHQGIYQESELKVDKSIKLTGMDWPVIDARKKGEIITVTSNTVRDHRNGIYLEFAKKSVIERNTVEDNLRYGLHYMFSHDSAYRHNRFERNGAGVAVMYTRNVEMSSNHFINNWGSSAYGLMLKDMTDGRIFDNNHWDKYEGYDLKRDGTGDVPFRPVSLYAVVVGRIPSSVLLLRSLIVHLLDQAEKAFPSITPERVVDEKPAMRPIPISRHPETMPTDKP